MGGKWRVLLLLVYALLWLFLFLNGNLKLDFESLHRYRSSLTAYVRTNLVGTLVSFVCVYAVLVGLSFPGSTALTLLGGMLFPQPHATIASVLGATAGATCVFYFANTLVGSSLKKKVDDYHDRWNIRKYLLGNQYLCLLVLRIIPIFPFWFVNVLPAALGVSTSVFITSTLFGIVPGSFLYTEIGKTLGDLLESGMTNGTLPSTHELLTSTNLAPAVIFLGVWVTLLFSYCIVKTCLDKRRNNNVADLRQVMETWPYPTE